MAENLQQVNTMNPENTKLLTLLDTLSGALTELKSVMTSPVTDSDMTLMREQLTLLREEVFALRTAHTKLSDAHAALLAAHMGLSDDVQKHNSTMPTFSERITKLESQPVVGPSDEALTEALQRIFKTDRLYNMLFSTFIESTIEDKLNDDLESSVQRVIEDMDLSSLVQDAFDQNVDLDEKVKEALDNIDLSEALGDTLKERINEVLKEATVTIEID